MTSSMTQIASDLNESVDNRFALVLELSEMAKRLLDEAREKVEADPFSSMNASLDKVICQALYMKASQNDIGDGLIG